MKLSVAFFALASVWHFVQGQEKSTSLRGSYAEAGPAEEDEIASSGDIMNSQVQSSHDSTTVDSEAIPSLPEFLCPVADRYKTEAGNSGEKIALKFYPGDDPVITWAIVIACNVALQELYNDLYPADEMTIHYDTVDNMELVIPDKQALMQAEVVGNTTLGDIPDQEHEGADSLCSVAYPYKTEAGNSGDKIALKFYPGDDPLETWASVVACNVALQELYNDLYPGDKMTIHYDIVDNMELVIPNKQALMQAVVVGNTTLGDIPDQEHEGADRRKLQALTWYKGNAAWWTWDCDF
jgi:hypothetical protein